MGNKQGNGKNGLAKIMPWKNIITNSGNNNNKQHGSQQSQKNCKKMGNPSKHNNNSITHMHTAYKHALQSGLKCCGESKVNKRKKITTSAKCPQQIAKAAYKHKNNKLIYKSPAKAQNKRIYDSQVAGGESTRAHEFRRVSKLFFFFSNEGRK